MSLWLTIGIHTETHKSFLFETLNLYVVTCNTPMKAMTSIFAIDFIKESERVADLNQMKSFPTLS